MPTVFSSMQSFVLLFSLFLPSYWRKLKRSSFWKSSPTFIITKIHPLLTTCYRLIDKHIVIIWLRIKRELSNRIVKRHDCWYCKAVIMTLDMIKFNPNPIIDPCSLTQVHCRGGVRNLPIPRIVYQTNEFVKPRLPTQRWCIDYVSCIIFVAKMELWELFG